MKHFLTALAMVAESAAQKVIFENLYIGACPMKIHWTDIEKAESVPGWKRFKIGSCRPENPWLKQWKNDPETMYRELAAAYAGSPGA